MQQKKKSLGYVCKQENNEANLVEICLLALRWIHLCPSMLARIHAVRIRKMCKNADFFFLFVVLIDVLMTGILQVNGNGGRGWLSCTIYVIFMLMQWELQSQ